MITQLRTYTQKLPGLFHDHEAYFVLICELAMLYAGFNLALSHFALFVGALDSHELFLTAAQAAITAATVAGFSLLALLVGSVVLASVTLGRRLRRDGTPFRYIIVLALLRLPLYASLFWLSR